jgi:serine kinase of HPr protein (carbohydrate metabolism regulator)
MIRITKILIALIILQGIWISSVFLSYISLPKKSEIKYLYFEELGDEKYNFYIEGYVIVEILRAKNEELNLDFEKIHNIFQKKVIFVILNSPLLNSQAIVSSALNYDNPVLVTNLTYENLLNAICNVSLISVPECIE